ncbi:hypothetical protein SASPL_143572 [Salvia splendens]|uniref:Uncharacterized protein n=1 Tax=Salvia splendens TaxID=180675 RepID=A0A8X8WMA8_SALSN|nr:hypothetical protein SASPL_143572 [Salvia splendens]
MKKSSAVMTTRFNSWATRTELRQGSWSKPTVREKTAWSDAVLSARRQQHGQPRPGSTVTFLLPALMVLRGSDLTRNSDKRRDQRLHHEQAATITCQVGYRGRGDGVSRQRRYVRERGISGPRSTLAGDGGSGDGVHWSKGNATEGGAVPTESGGCESRSTHDAKGSSQRCSDSRAERPVGDSPISGQEQWFPD